MCNSRERTQGYEKKQDEDSSYAKGIEVLLREMAQRNYPKPEDLQYPMIAPQDYDIRQSERVLLEFPYRDLWIRPTDLSWHFLILVTIREVPFLEFLWRVTRELESQRGQRQKTLTNRDDEWNSARWKQSSWQP